MLHRWSVAVLAPMTLIVGTVARSTATTPAGRSAVAQPVTLTEAQVKGFFDAMDALRAMGASKRTTKAELSKPEAFATALQVSGEGKSILVKNGFADVREFQRVGYNVAMAYGVLQRGGVAPTAKKLEKSKAQQAKVMEKLRAHLSPEQLKQLSAQMDGAMKMAETMQDVPPENVELLKQYRARVRALAER